MPVVGSKEYDLKPKMLSVVQKASNRRYVLNEVNKEDIAFRKAAEGRLYGLRVNRYSWWVHWRELADYILPRRYKWLITPNQMARGSPINQHILDSTGSLAARNLAAGLMTGCTDPTKLWFRLKLGHIDSTMPGPTSIWLKAVETIMYEVMAESNFYTAMAVFYFDLVVFGSAAMLIYEDFEHVIMCYNPCLGEYYLENSGQLFPNVLLREFTYTVSQTAEEFGVENLSPSTAGLWAQGGAQLTRELVVAHCVEPNKDSRTYGVPSEFAYRECYWEWGGSASPQGGSNYSPGLLRKRGFHESPAIIGRWDLVSNDAYGRSPGMDALPDIKQLQLETKRKAQGIDKQVNPPLVADVQLKNQPASLLPGGITYVQGMTQSGKPGMGPVYTVNPPLADITHDLSLIQNRIKITFYNDLFQTASQYETRSNVTAVEWDMRKAESMVMLGPVFERLNFETLKPLINRIFNMASRAGILPPAPGEIQGQHLEVEFVSMIQLAQAAAATAGIDRMFALAGQLGGIDPSATDNIDIDFGIEKYNFLLNNDPRLVRSPQQLQAIRQQRMQQQQQAQRAAEAEQLARSAKVASQTPIGQGQTALGAMIGAPRQ
jgi:hypothetical protein